MFFQTTTTAAARAVIAASQRAPHRTPSSAAHRAPTAAPSAMETDPPPPLSQVSLTGFGEPLLVFKPADEHAAAAAAAGEDTVRVLASVGGAELNSCIALARLCADDPPAQRAATSYITALPAGPLGERVLRVGREAGVRVDAALATGGAELGTMHVVDSGVHYQRRNSAFARLDPAAFDWPALLPTRGWLHLTGITPLLGEGPLGAWRGALEHAAARGVRVILDVNHRPALGSFAQLWSLILPQLPRVHTLVLSEHALEQLAAMPAQMGGAGLGAEGGGEDARPAALRTYAGRYELLQRLRAVWHLSVLVCCFKASPAAYAAAAHGEGAVPRLGAPDARSTIKEGGNVRWSVAATEEGLASTRAIPTFHQPRQATGGGDAWLAGFVSALPPAPAPAAPPSARQLLAALRRADLLAALAQQTDGDLSHCTGTELFAAEAKFAGAPAHLPPPPAAPPPRAPTRMAAAEPARAAAGSECAYEEEVDAMSAALGAEGVLAVVTLDDPEHAPAVVRALASGGVHSLEVMLRTARALPALAAAVRAARELSEQGGPKVRVGAGTVNSVEQLHAVADAGAAFAVSPGTQPAVLAAARARCVPFVPGVCTPTEIDLAMAHGCRLLKFFPAEAMGGVKTLSSVAAPYNKDVRFVPTGGLSLEKLPSYLARPEVLAVGGSWLVKASDGPPDLAAIVAAARDAISAARTARPSGAGPLPRPAAAPTANGHGAPPGKAVA